MRMFGGAVVLIVGISSAWTGAASYIVASPQGGTPGAEAAEQVTVQQYDEIEKTIDERYSALQKQLAARQLQEASKTAEQLAVAFGESEKFWAQRKKADAVKWAQNSREFATQVVGATTAGDIAKTEQAAVRMRGACNQCHAAYREMDPASGYRIKAAALVPR